MSGLGGIEAITLHEVRTVPIVLQFSNDGIVDSRQPASRGNFRGACKRSGKSEYLHFGHFQLSNLNWKRIEKISGQNLQAGMQVKSVISYCFKKVNNAGRR